jgi:hypothetical protein
LLALTLAVGVAYVVTASRLNEITQNDGAYYYSVARHIALTGRFEEPLLWHFLHLPEQIVHAPFDYWGGMTALLLVPPLALFGATPRVAFATMSLISTAALVAFWYLVCVALPLRHRATQLLALALFAFSPVMTEYRFQPESIAVAQLFILLALIAFSRRRDVAAVLLGFCILLTRGDGLIFFALITLAVLLAAARDPVDRRRRVATSLAVAAACLTTYVVWSLVSFGTPTPPAPATLPFLHSYWQVFDYGVTHPRAPRDLLRWFEWDYLGARAELLWLCLRNISFTPLPAWWFVIALLPALTLLRRPLPEALIWILCFAGFWFVVWVAGPGFYFGRTPNTFTPLIILAGALGLDMILSLFNRLASQFLHGTARNLAIGAATVALCALFIPRPPLIDLNQRATRPYIGRHLSNLDAVLHGEPVASNIPWYLTAYTQSPAASIPLNGETAIANLIDRYDIRWMVVSGRLPYGLTGESQTVMDDIVAGTKTTLGQFRVERVHVPKNPAIFRVEPTTD